MDAFAQTPQGPATNTMSTTAEFTRLLAPQIYFEMVLAEQNNKPQHRSVEGSTEDRHGSRRS